MGQKVHPYGFRLGYTKPWKSRWFAERDYDKQLLEDVKLKAELKEKLKSAGVSSIEIERPGNKLRVMIKTARPGIIIGRKGAEIDKLKAEVQKRMAGREVFIDTSTNRSRRYCSDRCATRANVAAYRARRKEQARAAAAANEAAQTESAAAAAKVMAGSTTGRSQRSTLNARRRHAPSGSARSSADPGGAARPAPAPAGPAPRRTRASRM